MKKVLVKLLIITLCVSILICLHSSEIVTATSLNEKLQENQEKKQEAEQNLQYVQEELSETIVKIQQLDDNIRVAEKEVNELNSQLSDLQSKIDDTTKRIEQKEKDYNENQKLTDERLIAMYKYGETTYLDVLLNSASIVDFISTYYSLKKIVDNDFDLLKTIQTEKEDIEKEKSTLEQQKVNLKVMRAKREQTSIVMQNNRTIQQNYINQLSAEEQELQRKVEEFKNEEQRIENLIHLASNLQYMGEYTGGLMAWPIAKSGTYITSGYGSREHPIQGVVRNHSGIDIGNAGFGAPVIAAADGVVTMADWYGGYGNCVMINHGNGISTLYGHGQTILTTVGTEVKKGDLIMEVGSTGNSTGPHVHFEVRINGSCVNPLPYLTGEIENTSNSEQ